MPIKPTPDGGYEISVCVRRQRVHRRLPPGTSASAAKHIEAELRAALGRGSVAIPGDPPLTELMAGYVAHAKSLRSPQTAIYHALRIGRWCDGFRASEARQVRSRIVADLAPHYAAGTVNRSLGTLRKALRLAWESGRTPADYSSLVQMLPDRSQRTSSLTLAQVAMLASHASDAVAAAIWISVFTGCRRGEVCKIVAADIGPDTITIQAGNTKTERTRTIPIIAPLRPWLVHLPLTIKFEGVKSGFRRARESAGMPGVQYRDLRRSCGTLMIRAGVPLHVVSRILGHTSTTVTERVYAHLDTQQMHDGLATLSVLHQRLHQASSAATTGLGEKRAAR